MTRSVNGAPGSAVTGRLAGKVAVVTGAAHGIGAAIATRFVAEGALVTVADVAEKDGRALADRLGEACRFAAPGATNLYSCALGGADGNELVLALAEGFFEAAQGVTGTASLVSTTVDVPAAQGK